MRLPWPFPPAILETLGVNDGLPIDQSSKRQARAAELLIEPDTKVMQSHFSGQTGTEAAEIMRPLPIQAEAVVKTAIDRFDDLTKTRQPAAPRPRPGVLTVALRGTDHLGAIGMPPLVMPRGAFKPFIGDVGTLSRRPYTR